MALNLINSKKENFIKKYQICNYVGFVMDGKIYHIIGNNNLSCGQNKIILFIFI